MGKKCLKQYQTYPECCLTLNSITLSQFSNFPKLGQVLPPYAPEPSVPPPPHPLIGCEFLTNTTTYIKLGTLY